MQNWMCILRLYNCHECSCPSFLFIERNWKSVLCSRSLKWVHMSVEGKKCCSVGIKEAQMLRDCHSNWQDSQVDIHHEQDRHILVGKFNACPGSLCQLNASVIGGFFQLLLSCMAAGVSALQPAEYLNKTSPNCYIWLMWGPCLYRYQL